MYQLQILKLEFAADITIEAIKCNAQINQIEVATALHDPILVYVESKELANLYFDALALH